ncbi:uncharacterized protein N7498_007099 [Penicillium cinerascens]|uniref:Uncharacterized protein n=1 Tax=Penicillium cinerascens TaxID=70096 RepID=A0A9W9JL75_9EURO|nr:uncharacterized protein N7498_007099 [Penicillium cinerascens]KAJ5197982.1 hypothetical protein N7498_007099 [Penicillium cinerascens]
MSKSDLENSSDSDAPSNANAVAAAKPTVWQRFKASLKRWWWCYVIGVSIVVLVVVLPIVYVGIPHIANSYINKYQFDYEGLAITNPRPTAFHIKQSTKLKIGGGFSGSGTLTPFNASCKVQSSDEEFAVFTMPTIDFGKGANLDIDQDLELSCVDCMSQLAVEAVTNHSFGVLITGTPYLKYEALPTAHLNIHMLMHMNGYNFTGEFTEEVYFLNENGAFNVTSVDLLDPPVDGFNVNATMTIRNPTPFIIEMGHITFNLSMGGSDLGYIDLPNLMLQQDVSSSVVLGNLDISMLVHEALFGDGELGEVTIDVKGHSCDYNGLEIPYFAAAIKAIQASTTLDLLNYASSLQNF